MRAVVLLVAALLASAPGVPALTLPPGFASSVVAGGLDTPTGAAFLPDGRLLVLEKAGRVRLWKPETGLLPAPALTIPTCTASEMGLLGVVPDPAFDANGLVYLYHTQPPGGDPGACGTPDGRTNRIVRVRLVGDAFDPATLAVLFDGIRTDAGNHDGGALAIGPDGHLYAGVGDAGVGDGGPPGASSNPYAQDVTSPNGKVLRLRLDGGAVPGGPFAGRGGAADFVWAYGLRNPWRIAFEPGSGLLWVGDVGQRTWEEIDVVRAGDNLGWPQCEALEPSPRCPGDTVPPIHHYGHDDRGASVTGGVFYRGTRFPAAYRGSYFFGDYVLDLIWRGVPTASGDDFTAPPEVFARDAGAPVDFTVGPDGGLYYVALTAGEVRRILPSEGAEPTTCARDLLRRAARWLAAAAPALARCAGTCPEPPGRVRAATGALARALRRACAAPPPALCDGLGCTACADGRALAACTGTALERLATEVTDGTSLPGDRCAASATRAALGFAAARLRGIGRCVRRGSGGCVPGEGDADRLARRLARRCAAPPPALCAAFGCASCGDAPALAACIAADVGARVDTLAVDLGAPPAG